MTDEAKAVLVGAFFGGVVAGVWAWRKGKELERRGLALAASLETQGDEVQAFLLTQGESVQRTLARFGQAEATRVAQATAEQYMGEVYGLTPERIANIGRLAQSLGAGS